MRRWVVRASSRPPPRAREERAERVGMGRWEMDVKVVRREVRKAVVLSRNNQVSSWFRKLPVRGIGAKEIMVVGKDGRATHSSLLNPRLSFRSAPAQKASSTSLATMRALVGPWGPSLWMSLMCRERSASRAREMALRFLGLLRERMRMEPLWGAGMFRMLIKGGEVLLRRIWRLERRRGGPGRERGRMVAWLLGGEHWLRAGS